MATAIRLQHPATGLTKIGYTGFSWTSLFFGGFPALLRGDVGIGLGMIVVGIIWAFIYNKIYTTRLVEAGYKLADTPERVREAQRALGIGDQAVL